jgi:hypothetical protein
MSLSSRTPNHCFAAAALTAMLSSSAWAADLQISTLSMAVHTVAKTCQVVGPVVPTSDCSNNNQYAFDADHASTFGVFASLNSASAVTGTEPISPLVVQRTSFPGSASAITTMGFNNAFSAHLITDRASVDAPYWGTYQTGADTTFSFTTTAPGAMNISYLVNYARPSNDSTLGAGYSFTSSSFASGGESALPTGAFGGTSTGTWSVDLTANTTYNVTLSADNSRAFTVFLPPTLSSNSFGRDFLDATYQVSFTTTVPEPGSWALLAAGLAVLCSRRVLQVGRTRD